MAVVVLATPPFWFTIDIIVANAFVLSIKIYIIYVIIAYIGKKIKTFCEKSLYQ